MSKELTKLWVEYKSTERYKQAVQNKKAAGMGLGFMSAALGQEADVFTDFMNWLVEKQGTSE